MRLKCRWVQLPLFQGGRKAGREFKELIAAEDAEETGRNQFTGGVEEERAVGGFSGDEFDLDEGDGGGGGRGFQLGGFYLGEGGASTGFVAGGGTKLGEAVKTGFVSSDEAHHVVAAGFRQKFLDDDPRGDGGNAGARGGGPGEVLGADNDWLLGTVRDSDLDDGVLADGGWQMGVHDRDAILREGLVTEAAGFELDHLRG